VAFFLLLFTAMQKILTTAEMREVDRLSSEEHGIPSATLMQNAALAAAAVIEERLDGAVSRRSFLIFCGKGNNGGDGAALAWILSEAGARVYAVLLGKVDETKGDARTNFNIISVYNDNLEPEEPRRRLVFYACDDAQKLRDTIMLRYETLETCDMIVDAILGTGVIRPLEGLYLGAVELINELREKNRCETVLAIDLPSGLYGDSAVAPEVSIKADVTVTFTAPKLANVFPPANRGNGNLVIADIGSPQELIDDAASQTFLIGRSDSKNWLDETQIREGSYKKNRGHVLLAVGSRNYNGAAVLAANAAVRSGAGLVTAALPCSIQTAYSERVEPEAMDLPLPETGAGAIAAGAVEKFLEFSKKVTVAAIGCGMSSNEESTRQFVRDVVQDRKVPMVLDADALNSLSPFTIKGSDELPLILTPHKGEFARLLGIEKLAEDADTIALSRDFSVKYNVILVLKGERSLIANPDGRVAINPTGNAGVGKGGNGDTLTGAIAGFMAQTWAQFDETTPASQKIEKTFECVVASMYIAGMAADIAAAKFGMRTMTASNVSESVGEAIANLND
jgi:NAD(P)H-hydrate epimerase